MPDTRHNHWLDYRKMAVQDLYVELQFVMELEQDHLFLYQYCPEDTREIARSLLEQVSGQRKAINDELELRRRNNTHPHQIKIQYDPAKIRQVKESVDMLRLFTSLSSNRLTSAGGRNYKASCPFHEDRSPSLFINPARKIWHCMSCGRGGDSVKLVQEVKGLPFVKAMEYLERYGR